MADKVDFYFLRVGLTQRHKGTENGFPYSLALTPWLLLNW
jgi:hypothetical protein